VLMVAKAVDDEVAELRHAPPARELAVPAQDSSAFVAHATNIRCLVSRNRSAGASGRRGRVGLVRSGPCEADRAGFPDLRSELSDCESPPGWAEGAAPSRPSAKRSIERTSPAEPRAM
jgi:hypothetical protein